MPEYAYKCRTCEMQVDAFNRVAECESNAPVCCDHRMSIQIQPVMGSVQCEAHYKCPATGELITSHRQRRNNFARHGLMDANDYTPAYMQKRDEKKWEGIRKLAAEGQRDNVAGVSLHDVIDPIPGA